VTNGVLRKLTSLPIHVDFSGQLVPLAFVIGPTATRDAIRMGPERIVRRHRISVGESKALKSGGKHLPVICSAAPRGRPLSNHRHHVLRRLAHNELTCA
jgi:hypothetical protein